ncbi:MAG: LamG domain-containing protein [Deltaproteobacteria bacterium]|nr:LamG domain-containing protein [Deltaproteobacteria bacterium]
MKTAQANRSVNRLLLCICSMCVTAMGCYEIEDIQGRWQDHNPNETDQETDDVVTTSTDRDTASTDSDTRSNSSSKDSDSPNKDTGRPDSDVSPPVNRCLALDGKGDYVRIRHNDDLFHFSEEWTMEAWVWYRDDDTGLHPILRGADESTSISAYFMYAQYDSMEGRDKPMAGFGHTASGYEALVDDHMLNTERWIHMAYVHTPTKHRFFLNGEQVDSDTVNEDTRPIADDVIIGAILHPRKTGYLNGYLDEIRISTVARYKRKFTPSRQLLYDGNTLVLWNFDEDFGEGFTMDVTGTYFSELNDDAHIVDCDSIDD